MIVSNERVAEFLAQRLAHNIVPPYVAVGIEKDGEVIGGVLLNHFTGNDIHMSAAGSGWTRPFVRSIGEYVFGRLGCGRMTVVTGQPRVVRLAEQLGGEVEGLMRNHFGEGRHAFIVGILKKDWRF
ncbi:GNAT family N-acetyltransferase [Devosia nitrariae]|nr:GNAT family protein [Devosia nitrariae]